LEANQLDNAQMVYDFGLLKGTVKEFIDSMDHCYLLCEHDSDEFREFIKTNCDRWIELPFNPSAEMLSMFVFNFVERILVHTIPNNGEGNVHVKAVRYHETTTGYAEASKEDMEKIYKSILGGKKCLFSPGVIRDWSDDLYDVIAKDALVENPVVDQQIKL
jgi:6-pyruvoyltetrahydropterin/6-carboxytetrahydropterin synthase